MNKKILGLVGVATLALGALVILPSMTLAYRGDASVKGPNYTVERHDAMEKAFDNNDFTAWQTLMTGRGNVTQVVTKDNFAKFSQIHKLTEEGKTVEANALRAELGLGLHNGKGNGMGQGRGMGMMHNR
ncbi:MAG: hypothetical protein WCW04_01395 [Candidatus Paceibacterota bacterium]|jgi:hypothetical protein